jgi:hypothetical protein
MTVGFSLGMQDEFASLLIHCFTHGQNPSSNQLHRRKGEEKKMENLPKK